MAQVKWPTFRFTLPFIVQCLVAVHTGRLQLKDPKKMWQGSSESEIKSSWNRTERAFGQLVEFLTSTVQWKDSTLIPSFNALIPLVWVLASTGGWTVDDKRLARRWLLLASVHRHFSGSVQTEIDALLRKLGPKPSIQQLWGLMQRQLRRLRPTDFETSRISGPIMSMYLSMLRNGDARDWQDNDFRLDGTVAGHGAALHVHHFFPRALLHKHKDFKVAEINTFANYTIISAKTNLNVSSEEPASYVERIGIPEAELTNQCIPADRELWRASKYREFLRERRKLLAERSNTFLGL